MLGGGLLASDLFDVEFSQRTLVLIREDLDEPAAHGVPMVEECQRTGTAGELQVPLDHASQQHDVAFAAVAKASPACHGEFFFHP